MKLKTDDPSTDLRHALAGIFLRPRETVWAAWSWKAAIASALIRAAMFYQTNLRAGRYSALRAGLVEITYAIVAAGLMGAVSQRLRLARPMWATGLIVWLGMPAVMLLAQLGVHRLAGTQHLGLGLLLSFCLAALASAFSWYAMRHGALLGGTSSTTLRHDAYALPRITRNFLLAGPRLVLNLTQRPQPESSDPSRPPSTHY